MRWQPVAGLTGGYAASATAVFGAAYLLGCAIPASPNALSNLIASMALVVFFAADTGLTPLRTPMWRRQTPRNAIYRFGVTGGATLWGLDAGLAFTTFRITSLTWAGFAVTVLHLVPWWSGVVYALFFGVPSAVLTLMRGRREWPDWYVMDRLAKLEPAVRRVALVGLGLATLACAGWWLVLMISA